jgi:hypothetical protein
LPTARKWEESMLYLDGRSFVGKANSMRALWLAILFLMASSVSGQVTVNGKVPGELWRTDKAKGEVEVFHVWGRTATMPVKEAWVNIDGDTISIGAKCDKPVLDGKPREGYHMAYMSGKLSKDFPTEIQTITQTEIWQLGNNQEFRTTKTATIVMDDGKPKSLVFTCIDFAMFDVKAFIKQMNDSGNILDKRSVEDLKGYDDMGFRVRKFQAVFH